MSVSPVAIGIIFAVIIILSIYLRLYILKRRRTRAAAPIIPTAMLQQRRRNQTNQRRNFSRQPARTAGTTRSNPVHQPVIPPTVVQQPSTTPIVRPTSYPEPFFHPITPPPEPVHFPIPQPHLATDADVTRNLVERMRQVQTMIMEINRMENDSRSGIDHRERIKELQQRIAALSDTTPGTTTTTTSITAATTATATTATTGDVGQQQQASSNPPPTSLPGAAGFGEPSDPPPAYDALQRSSHFL